MRSDFSHSRNATRAAYMVNWELLGNDPYPRRSCHPYLIHNCWELLALPLSCSQCRDALALMQQLSARPIFRSHYSFIKPHAAEARCDRLVCTHVLPTLYSQVCSAWPRSSGAAPRQHHPCTSLGAFSVLVCTKQFLRRNSQQLQSITMGNPTQPSSSALPIMTPPTPSLFYTGLNVQDRR